ncbi:N,N-dimethylformamidase beta subunit family domain-containing protein [Paenarthrobacter sp. NPDC090520]|uniref:N,N-dimethylformamidase beta subunit family domain-containing protein n=1 Tax=Paenarthrobacter sp. NPDC090520 TaxID=3364382 RepID=UPI0038077D4E
MRDGLDAETVWSRTGLPGKSYETPVDSYAVGCKWPVALSIPVDEQWRPGFYLLIMSFEHEGRIYEREHFAVIKRAPEADPAPTALVLTTSTMLAYNDWGGANHYRGLGDDPWEDVPSPLSAIQRPVARGMLRQPEDAPRSSNPSTPGPGYIPRHPAYEYAHVHGFSRHYADAFWATYERHFVRWAEQHGYELDYLTQHDLHEDQAVLDRYACAVVVGHDEYWTGEMRDTAEGYVERGGHLARFGGNFLWQVRLEDNGNTQACYRTPQEDPLTPTEPSRVTTAWDSPVVGRPAATTFGLTGLGGCYNRYGTAAPRSSGGFTVYRPRHWAFTDTDLNYGDIFGAAPINVAAFELDGVDFTFRKGMPEPTGVDGAPESLEIIAMTPATLGEEDKWDGAVPLGAPVGEFLDALDAIYGDDLPERFKGECYGSGMVATFTKGAGEVFTAGSTEWVNGLRLSDPFTEQITHNVLRRFTS